MHELIENESLNFKWILKVIFCNIYFELKSLRLRNLNHLTPTYLNLVTGRESKTDFIINEKSK